MYLFHIPISAQLAAAMQLAKYCEAGFMCKVHIFVKFVNSYSFCKDFLYFCLRIFRVHKNLVIIYTYLLYGIAANANSTGGESPFQEHLYNIIFVVFVELDIDG